MSTFEFEERHDNLRIKPIEAQLIGWHLQYQFFSTLQRHHLLCATTSADMEALRIHVEIANLMKQTIDQYKLLLDKNYCCPD